MKELKDYSNEINKCSKCGLCQSVCPIYKETGNDCAVSRGKFVMLDGVLKGDLKLNKNINKYLEMCLKCDKCTKFCPSGIDVCEIFRTAKHEYLKSSLEGKIIRFLQSEKLFNGILSILNRSKNNPNGQILYFKGCAEKVYPNNFNAVKNILNALNLEITEPNFDCCGIPFLSSGNLERFEQAYKKNSEIINSFNKDFVLTDCTTCEDVLKKQGFNVKNTGDFIKDLDIKFKFKKNYTVTFHKPCHLKNDSFVQEILVKCENIKYRQMENYDDCCGFSGQFGITNRKLSLKLSQKKAQAALDTNADIILTTCPACIIGLEQGLIAQKGLFGKKPKIMYLSEFLGKASIINPLP